MTSKNQEDYNSDEEDDELYYQLLHDLGLDLYFLESVEEALKKGDGPLCQPIDHSSLDFGAHINRRAKICQLCEYKEKGEIQFSVNVCLSHSARVCTHNHPPLVDAGLVRVDDREPVTDFLWACPNAEWFCWNKCHHFYLQKGM
jgi:hypothetical protein